MTQHSAMTTRFEWNGEIINFSSWADDAFGAYDYTTRDRLLRVLYQIFPSGNEAAIGLIDVVGWPADQPLPAVKLSKSRLLLIPPAGIAPRNVPEALMLVVMWAEGALRIRPS